MGNRGSRLADFVDSYTRDLKAEDLQRLFTRDAREAYKFFTRGADEDARSRLRWHKRALYDARRLFVAFTMKLSPARRFVYAASLIIALLGFINLLGARTAAIRGGSVFPDGFGSLFLAFALLNLLVLLEVADRLSLKNDLEIARDIQQAMLPAGVFSAPGVETAGVSRPANTVGGDFYDILPLADGRVVVALGDVAGKGSPAALLMALLLAMLRTLVDEGLEPSELVTRLNVQVSRHAPSSRFITLFYAVFDPRTGDLTYVSAGHLPPLLLRTARATERLTDGGIALGMFPHSAYTTGRTTIGPGDVLALYSDGITEAENPGGRPFDESGLEDVLASHRTDALPAVGSAVLRAVEQYCADTRLADDLTILLLRRSGVPAAAGV